MTRDQQANIARHIADGAESDAARHAAEGRPYIAKAYREFAARKRAEVRLLLTPPDPATEPAADHDDTALTCPGCDQPNQFGETCPDCRRDIAAESAEASNSQ